MVALIQKLAILVAIGTLALFFFPMASGSFQATHGPVTALRAVRSVRALLAAIAALFSSVIAFTAQNLGIQEAVLEFSKYGSSPILCLRC